MPIKTMPWSWPLPEMAGSTWAARTCKRTTSPARSRIASPTALTKPFTSAAMLAPSTAMSSPLWTKSGLPALINWGCLPRGCWKNQRNPLVRLRIETARPRRPPLGGGSLFAAASCLLMLGSRAGSHPARPRGARRCSNPGPQETRYGNGSRRRSRRVVDAERGAAHRYLAGADHHLHGHHTAHSEWLGCDCSATLAEQAAGRRARKQDGRRAGRNERQAQDQPGRYHLGRPRPTHGNDFQGTRREDCFRQGR